MSLASLARKVRGRRRADAPFVPVALALEAITKRYDSGRNAVAAVSDVTLEIRPGELMALMGPSGSGKTTLLSIMGGILRPTSGRVIFCGADIGQMTEEDRSRVRLGHIGFVFQHYNLFPALTARQNVEIALDLRGVTGRNRRDQADELLVQMELGDKADIYPGDLSGGQRQRVAIARALAGAPSIILADEPTAALDSQNGRVIMTILRALAHERQRAVVIVTHDNRIIDFVDRTVAIEDGRINSDTVASSTVTSAAALSGEIIRSRRIREWAVAT
jgi:putative ABC transport system ATP-binding protein